MASPPTSQKPILLQGHERSITQIKYNREGDLLFTVAKDPVSAAGPARPCCPHPHPRVKISFHRDD